MENKIVEGIEQLEKLLDNVEQEAESAWESEQYSALNEKAYDIKYALKGMEQLLHILPALELAEEFMEKKVL